MCIRDRLDNSLKDISGVTGSAAGNLTEVQKALSDSASLLNEASGKMSNAATADVYKRQIII